MQTNDFFKLVTDQAMPDRALIPETIFRTPAPKRRTPLRYFAAAAAAAALLCAAGLYLQGIQPTPTPAPAPNQSALSAAPAPAPESSPQSSAQEESPEPPVSLFFNQLDETASADSALARWIYDNAQEWDYAQVSAYLGETILPADLPDDLQPVFDEQTRWMYAENPETGNVWGQFGFTWREHPDSTEYDPLERSLRVSVARGELLSCGVYLFREEMTPSTVCGVTVYAGRRQMGYGPYTVAEDGPNIPAGYYDVLIAQFKHDGLHYDITAENLTQKEFTAAVVSLLKARTNT